MSQIATMSVAVEIEEGKVVQVTSSTNLEDWTFWRQIVDRLWMDQIRGEGKEPTQDSADG